MTKFNCKNCKHQWLPRVENPKQCPMCKHYLNRGKNDTTSKTSKRVK